MMGELIVMFGDVRFKNRLFIKITAGTTGMLSLASAVFAAPHAFAGSPFASVRFDRADFAEYGRFLLPNMLTAVLLVMLTLTVSIWMVRMYSTKKLPS